MAGRLPIVSADDQGRSAHGRRRLPRPERRDPSRGAHGGQAPRPRAGGPALRLGGRHGGRHDAADAGRPRPASCPAAAPSWAPRAPTRSRTTSGLEQVLATLERHDIDALIAIGGEDTLGVRPAAAREHGRAGGRGAEDDRQRPRRHRLHLRLRHRGADRHRGHRPAAHHGRVAQPGHRRRGHGPPRRLDRRVRRHRRRRRRHPGAGAPGRHREVCDAPAPPPRLGQELLDRGGGRGRRVPGRAERRSVAHGRRPTQFGHARLGGIGRASLEGRSRSAPATRPA